MLPAPPMSVRALRLPARFFLPRTPAAAEPEDDHPEPRMSAFATDFEGVNMDALVDGIRSYMDLHPVLKTVWADDLQTLDALRARFPHHDGS